MGEIKNGKPRVKGGVNLGYGTEDVKRLWEEIKHNQGEASCVECINEDDRFRTPFGIGIFTVPQP
jgi:hypothetical protein